jgi:hypothetical protein
MNTTDIIIEINAEISRLREARELLTSIGTTSIPTSGRPSKVQFAGKATSYASAKSANKPATKRTFSAEVRAKMAAAQKARWAKAKKVTK